MAPEYNETTEYGKRTLESRGTSDGKSRQNSRLPHSKRSHPSHPRKTWPPQFKASIAGPPSKALDMEAEPKRRRKCPTSVVMRRSSRARTAISRKCVLPCCQYCSLLISTLKGRYPLLPGVYCPAWTFFHEDESLTPHPPRNLPYALHEPDSRGLSHWVPMPKLLISLEAQRPE